MTTFALTTDVAVPAGDGVNGEDIGSLPISENFTNLKDKRITVKTRDHQMIQGIFEYVLYDGMDAYMSMRDFKVLYGTESAGKIMISTREIIYFYETPGGA
ncbi:MAG: hypothetical protein ACRD98_00665 [Nitrososphaera sp.]